MKTYRGFPARTPKGGFIVTVEEGNRKRDLPPKNNLRNHSPNGFNWGYGGSGPAQLSLASAVMFSGMMISPSSCTRTTSGRWSRSWRRTKSGL